MASLMPYGEFSESQAVQQAGATILPGDAQAATGLVGPPSPSVSADYFASIGLKMIAGREFSAAEDVPPTAGNVAIIDEPLARRLFGSANAIGQPVQFSPRTIQTTTGRAGSRRRRAQDSAMSFPTRRRDRIST